LRFFLVGTFIVTAPTQNGSNAPLSTPSLTPTEIPTTTTGKYDTGNLTAHFIDVGQGDSILFTYHDEAILIDAGGSKSKGEIIVSYLQNQGVDDIDLLIISHPHADHFGGLSEVIRAFAIDQVLDNGQTSLSYENRKTEFDAKNIPVSVALRGQEYTFDSAVTVRVLSPPVSGFFGDTNEDSVVVRISYGSIDFLMTGDAESEANKDMLLQSFSPVESEVLKVGHHGSNGTVTSEFLAIVDPEVSVIEVGAGNTYGHPTPQTLALLDEYGTKIFRTDLNGDIVITTDGSSFSVTTKI
jgi:competence protein ComEC